MIDTKNLEFNEKLTQEFVDKSIDVLVFVNTKTNKKLYLKPVHRDGKFINLEPLTKEEMEDAEIQESLSETINGSLFDLDIEETVDEVVQPLRKVANFDVSSVESMKAARQLADEQLRKLEKNSSHDVDVKVLEQENAEMKERLDLIAENAFQAKRQKLQAPPEIDTPEKLKGFEVGKNNKVSSGVVPLESQTSYQGDFMTKNYANSADLVRSLRIAAQSGDERAKSALNALFLKGLQSDQEFKGKSEGVLLKDLRKKKSD